MHIERQDNIMQNVYDLAHELARSLKETDQYKDLKRTKQQIDSDETLKKMVEDFNSKNFQIQTAIATGQQPDEEALKQIQSMYSIVMQDPSCAAYFNAEAAFSTILADISKILGEMIDA